MSTTYGDKEIVAVLRGVAEADGQEVLWTLANSYQRYENGPFDEDIEYRDFQESQTLHIEGAVEKELLRFRSERADHDLNTVATFVSLTAKGNDFLRDKTKSWWERAANNIAGNLPTILTAVVTALLIAFLLNFLDIG
ncbi:hypothetical protein [Roseicitreum antarcticum]|uniref:Uncharacterized protein n=1 Tax=Roseicitreum antarcticum TaxID=564137 RepID=A0A1H2SC62_9RHOB|nr:hypothetical protein [Roseicitreum antarcticum]SDW29226.1 hypothetical protein SAMN04488238_101566 [Roseicitreum antarcticum]